MLPAFGQQRTLLKQQPCRCLLHGGVVYHPQQPHQPAALQQRQRRTVVAQGGSGEDASKTSSTEWLVPDRLLPAGAGPASTRPPGSSGAAAQQEGDATTSDAAAPAAAAAPAPATASTSTVYTLRLSTSWDRGAALSEPMAGVHVCLIGKSGAAVLHRISPVNDPQDRARMMQDICSSVGDEVGADCSILDSLDQQPAWPAGKEPVVKPRFQEGSVDEISFVAPELGPLAAIMVAPEGGSWVCDEVDVYSSRSNHIDRFVCRARLGGRKGEPAAYLTPVPPNAVVYGTGDAARIVSKEQAAVLQELSMVDYQTMKLKLLMTTALLTAGGSGVAALTSGADAAVPFALGGAAGLLYQWLLQLGADAAVAQAVAGAGGASSSTSNVAAAVSSFSAAAARSRGARVPAGPVASPLVTEQPAAGQEAFKDRLLQVLGSSAFRLLLLSSAIVVAVSSLQEVGPGGSEGSRALLFQLRPVDAWQLGVGLCGFMMFKVAVLGVSLSTPASSELPEAAQRLEKNVQ